MIHLRQNISAQRFEMELGGEFGYVDYIWQRGSLYLLKTVATQKMIESREIDKLYKAIIEHAKEEKINLIINCPSFQKFVNQHPE